MKIVGIIPARYASSRFPGKPLADIQGKTMIQRVYEQATQCKDLSEVIVATDDHRIISAVERFGGQTCMTETTHLNGTERCAEVAKKHLADFYVNIQGDEPFIDPTQITLLCSLLQDASTAIATLIKKIDAPSMLDDSNVVKVVVNDKKEAMYFSRASIPFLRDIDKKDRLTSHIFYHHIGIYGYRQDVLEKIVRLSPSPLERAESLEQLRWMTAGFTISTKETSIVSTSIDTPQDIENLSL